jgi:myo-inositol-1-phosphate synthase
MDGKTGQTLLKTALAAMFRARRLHIEGWYSTNFLGNNDGLEVLDAPGSNKTKVMSKSSVLDSIVGYHVENHQVHIHYYKPRGDSKEAWDNIDIVGFAGVPMQIKVNFLCSGLGPRGAARRRSRAPPRRRQARRRAGIQRQLSIFFKSPYHAEGETRCTTSSSRSSSSSTGRARSSASSRPVAPVIPHTSPAHTNGVKHACRRGTP